MSLSSNLFRPAVSYSNVSACEHTILCGHVSPRRFWRRRLVVALMRPGMVAWVSVVLLGIVLVPLVAISFYNHSYADDWHYGVWAHLSLEETGGDLLAAFSVAIEQVGKAWFEWQGTYTAILLMALEPGVFGEGAYVWSALIILTVLVAATFFFAHVFVCELLHADKSTGVTLACIMLIVQLLLQPSTVEGIYWYNSAIYYTFYHSLMLVLVACIARMLDPARPRSMLRNICTALLGAFIAGGNYVTMLVSTEFVCALLIALMLLKRPTCLDLFPTVAALVIGATVSMVAPGNDVRQLVQFPHDKLGVVDTVWQSAVACFRYMGLWTTIPLVLGCLVALPLIVRAVSSKRAASLVWRMPALVTIGSIVLLATSFTPTFYSMGSVGPGRVQNCRFDLFIVLVMVNLVWWSGWVVARTRNCQSVSSALLPAAPVRGLSLRTIAGSCLVMWLLFVLAVGTQTFDRRPSLALSSVSAARSLISGQAARYDAQVKARLAYLQTSTEDSLVVPYYTDVPEVLYMGDIKGSMDDYVNYRLAQWYGKKSIVGTHGNKIS